MEAEEDIALFVSTYPPRECGIATFTRDLSDAIEKKFFPYLSTKILAMNSNGVNIYNYPKKVMYQLSDSDKKGYSLMAKKINENDAIKFVSIQHEFGIFGGEMGEYLIEFLRTLNKPKIITFHSILPKPDKKRKEIVNAIAENVDEIIVMTKTGIDILEADYSINENVKLIPHGIPNVQFEKQLYVKKNLGYEEKIILSSFGMISRGKGYEYVIESLPEVVKAHPNLLYLIVGATHPNIRKEEGENYRNFLARRVKELGLESNVKFYNKYVTLKEIIYFLKASDIYISSSLTPEQITSGTLAYAMGCGRAVVSTPFIHAKDMINSERGLLVDDFRNSESFKKSLLSILADKKKLREIEMNSYEYTRHMTWPNVAISYGELIKKYVEMPSIFFEQLPKINVSHIKKMTDNFGVVQFAKYNTPNINSGYTLDDNARALIIAAQLYSKSRNKTFLEMARTYLDYIRYVQDDDGKFMNVVSKDKSINKDSWSEEAHGRAIKSLGIVFANQSMPDEFRRDAKNILIKSIPIIDEIFSPRALADMITGLYNYNKENYSEEIIGAIKIMADRLVDLFEHNADEEWVWFEKELTYSNSKLSEALLYSYICVRDKKYLDIATRTLNFLISKTFEKEIFVPIGQNGWYKKGGQRAYFDQQPLDVACMVETLILAHKITRNLGYEQRAIAAFQWFLGKNTLKQLLYDEKTGGCYDGLDEKDMNLNQGAESTLSYLSARLMMEELL